MSDKPERSVETMRTKLQQDEYDISEDDRDMLLDFDRTIQLLGRSEIGIHQHEFLLRRSIVLAREVGGLTAALENRESAEDLVAWIHREKTSPETNKDYRVTLRNFGKHVTDGKDIPETLSWIPGGYPDNYDPAPDPGDMLHWGDDILPMIDAAHNSRDRALITLAWDLGPRPGELFDLTPANIVDHEYGLQVTVDGKRGKRTAVLVPSVPYVQRWLDDHPGDNTDPLWCTLNSGESITNNRIRDVLKAMADRADINKPVTPSNFRKSSASYLASQGVSQAHLEDHHGWKRGSEVASRYISIFTDANDRAVARAHGIDVEADEPEPTGPIICPRCDQKTPRERDVCVWCGQALSRSATEKIEERRDRLFESAIEAEGDLQQRLKNVQKEIEELRALGLDV